MTDITGRIVSCRESVTQLLHHTTSLFYTHQKSDICLNIGKRHSHACCIVSGKARSLRNVLSLWSDLVDLIDLIIEQC